MYTFINDGKHKIKCKHLVGKFAQTVRQHHHKLPPHVTKSRLTDKDKMTSSNINKYMFKSYLNFFKWVADGMQGCSVSNANIGFASVVFKKNI